jgi:anti-sigma factor RsiW
MNITRDVVEDLLPLYAAGEASADTRALVDAYLRTDPELARVAAALRDDALPGAAEPPPMEPSRVVLGRTKALLRRRTWCLASAIFLTGLPLSCAFDERGLWFFMLRDAPMASALSLTGAAIGWAAFAITARRLRVTGL